MWRLRSGPGPEFCYLLFSTNSDPLMSCLVNLPSTLRGHCDNKTTKEKNNYKDKKWGYTNIWKYVYFKHSIWNLHYQLLSTDIHTKYWTVQSWLWALLNIQNINTVSWQLWKSPRFVLPSLNKQDKAWPPTADSNDILRFCIKCCTLKWSPDRTDGLGTH